MRQGIALVLSAPSGAGKSTLSKMLLKEFPRLTYSISCTTRPMRPGEVEGADYFFLTAEEFLRMRDAGDFAEWAEVHGNYYGTPLSPVRSMLGKGNDVLFDVDVQGGAQIRKTLPEATSVFILPPDMNELKRRLVNRGSDTPENISLRLANAIAEIRQSVCYDAIIINDDIHKAMEQLRAVYLAATMAPVCHSGFINALIEEASQWSQYGPVDSCARLS